MSEVIKGTQKLQKGMTVFMCILMSTAFFMGMFGMSAHADQKTEREIIRAGFFPFAGYHEENGEGEKSGYGYDILQQMLVYENWQYEYVGYEENMSWNEALEKLEKGEIDILTSATMSQERRKKFSYSDRPIGYSSTILTVKAGDNRYETDDYSTWNNLRVGMIPNNSRNDSFVHYAEENGFSYEAVEYDTTDELMENLKLGKLDMIVTSNLLSMEGVRIVDKFDEKPFYVIVKRGNDRLLKEVNDALEKLNANEPAFIEKLHEIYYEPTAEGVVSFTREEQNFIESCNSQGRVFEALINPDRRPLSYWNEGEMQGLLTDICQTVFERSGLNIEFARVSSREEYVTALQSGEASIHCDFTGSRSAAENYGYIRTAPYYNSSTSMLVRRGYSGGGKRCALTKNSITNTRIANKPGIEYIFLDTMDQCMDAVRNGTVDFSYGYTRTVQEMVYADVTCSMACVTITDMPVDFSMGVNLREDTLLVSIINKCVDSISEKDISYLSEPYTYYDRPQASIISLLYEQPIILIVAVIVFLVIVFGIVLIIFNIKKHENDMQINKKLSQALEAAEKANHAKTSFLSRVSHNMRTPLNGILGLTALMKEKTTDAQQKRDLTELEISGQYLLNLINDTLDMSRIESGKLALNPTVCDGKALFDNCVRLAGISAKKKNIQLNVHVDNLSFTTLYVDVGRTEQVFMNVLGNAIKFTPEGGEINLSVRTLYVKDGIIMDEYTIEDTGIGISPEFLPHIFEAFTQEDVTRTTAYQGTGLGMPITKQLLTVMGGDIIAQSEAGKGARFIITMPMKIATAEQVEEWKHSQAELVDDTNLRGKHILLCEDHSLNTQIATRLLEGKGVIVEHAENGSIGMQMFAASPENYYDAVLMDIRMPVMDGLEATEAIRRLPRQDAKRIPIIAMTANAFAEDIQQTQRAGMNAHLAKPINPQLLYETLAACIRSEIRVY